MRMNSWFGWTAGFAALAVLAVMAGCGGDDGGPAGPSGGDVGDVHAAVGAVTAIHLLVGMPNAAPGWAAGGFGSIFPRQAAGDDAAAGDPGEPTDPVFNAGLQAWTWSWDLDFEAPGFATQTAQQDYRLQYVGPGGPQEDLAGATSIQVRLEEIFHLQTGDASGTQFETNLNYVVTSSITGFPDGPLRVVVNGSATGEAKSFQPSLSTVLFPSFTLDGDFTECTTSTAQVDFAPYSAEIVFDGTGEGEWNLLKNGTPLAEPVGYTEYVPCTRRAGWESPAP